jgi:hypothetical protein
VLQASIPEMDFYRVRRIGYPLKSTDLELIQFDLQIAIPSRSGSLFGNCYKKDEDETYDWQSS